MRTCTEIINDTKYLGRDISGMNKRELQWAIVMLQENLYKLTKESNDVKKV